MPHYYFNINDDDVTEDFEGAEFADDQAAHAYAVAGARSLASEAVRSGHLSVNHRIEIQNERRETVGIVSFGDAVDIRTEKASGDA